MESRNILTMCRLCLCENECLVNIFELNDLQVYVAAEVISDLLLFQVSETDGYPNVVCSTCLVKLTNFKLFKECCQKSKFAYDNRFVSSASPAKHQPELPIIKQEELDIDCTFGDGSEEPFEEFNSEELIESDTFARVDVAKLPSSSMKDSTQQAFDDGSGSEFCEIDSVGEASSDNDMEPLKLELDDESIDSIEEERDNETAPEKGVGSSKSSFECYHCNKVYMTKTGLRRHMSCHVFGKPYNCEVFILSSASSVFSQFTTFRKEERRKATVPEKRIGERKGRFECHCCRKVLMTKYSLKQHLSTHGIGNFFKCDVCGRICVSKSILAIHLRQHTGENPYKCTDCSALFRNNSNLKVHIRIHTNIKPFKCKECNLSFSRSDSLKSHMRLHSNLKPYSCGVCHAAFRHKSHLTVHVRTHSGDRPYKCTVCSKTFSQSSNLRTHQVVHSGEKPYPCPHCSKRFSQNQHLKRHLKRVCVEKC